MPSSQAYVIKIVEPHTELRLDKWIGWWIKLSSYTVRLEAENASISKVNIISPSSNYRIPSNWGAWNSFLCEWVFKALPCISISHVGSTFLLEPIIDECILSNTVWITASGSFLRSSPIEMTRLRALVSGESKSLKSLCRVELIRVSLELWPSQGFYFLGSQTSLSLNFFQIFHNGYLIKSGVKPQIRF